MIGLKHRNRFLWIPVAGTIAFSVARMGAQDRLKAMPGFDQYSQDATADRRSSGVWRRTEYSMGQRWNRNDVRCCRQDVSFRFCHDDFDGDEPGPAGRRASAALLRHRATPLLRAEDWSSNKPKCRPLRFKDALQQARHVDARPFA